VEVVLDPGPIPYAQIALFGDADLEHGLRHYGVEPEATTYRLIEIPLRAISDTQSMPFPQWRVQEPMLDAIDTGVQLPPLVVFRRPDGRGWGLLDGVNRAHAYLHRNIANTRAYELLAP
jgi:hypothetical protein